MNDLTEDELVTELEELSAEFAPRRFTLCQVDGDWQDGQIIGWGLAWDEEAIVYLVQARVLMTAPSAERARQRMARKADVRLVWVDSTVSRIRVEQKPGP
jgi:hypothetical protein